MNHLEQRIRQLEADARHGKGAYNVIGIVILVALLAFGAYCVHRAIKHAKEDNVQVRY